MKVTIEHRIGIQAPPEAIWSVVSDIARWKEWNPLYPRADGVVRIGAQLDLDLVLPGRKPQQRERLGAVLRLGMSAPGPLEQP